MSTNEINLQYATQSMHYTTQFIVSMSDDEVILDCGSVVMPAGDAGQTQLPIHTRMAMPWSAVQRLHRVLGELIEARTQGEKEKTGQRASLPPLSRGA